MISIFCQLLLVTIPRKKKPTQEICCATKLKMSYKKRVFRKTPFLISPLCFDIHPILSDYTIPACSVNKVFAEANPIHGVMV